MSKFKPIEDEIRKYPKEFIDTFIKLFETNKKYKHRVLYPHIAYILIKSRQAGVTTLSSNMFQTVKNLEIRFDSIEDFWNRWSRYKRLVVFL